MLVPWSLTLPACPTASCFSCDDQRSFADVHSFPRPWNDQRIYTAVLAQPLEKEQHECSSLQCQAGLVTPIHLFVLEYVNLLGEGLVLR